ncbi:MAG: hypothetical protein KC535_03905 [Nanoarchaeota archaeon]|nr:hypothetical protein [Nanoarchaeota archaeon]
MKPAPAFGMAKPSGFQEEIELDFEEQMRREVEENRPLEELVNSETFQVKKVTIRNEKQVRNGEVTYQKVTEFIVKASTDISVRKLVFSGNSIQVKEGETIQAAIPCYKEADMIGRGFYLPREYQKEEKAIEIRLMGNDQVKPYRSTDYHDFIPKIHRRR